MFPFVAVTVAFDHVSHLEELRRGREGNGGGVQ